MGNKYYKNRINWLCPKCKNDNISYGDYKVKNFELQCDNEECCLIFDKLYKDK